MHNKIYYSPLALKDLDEIRDYITNELMSPLAAESTVNGILETTDKLNGFPEAGSRLLFDNELDSGYRFVIFKKYMAFYHIHEDSIYVDRVIYGKRDYMKILFPGIE